MVEPLTRRLADSGREAVSEIARTLGELGDRRAAAPLLRVLRDSEDPKIVAACSEALARLGEFSAVYELLPRMRTSQNPMLNRSLTVNLGDLLGAPGGFYRILAHEERGRGTATERLLLDLARAVQHVRSAHGKAAADGPDAVAMVRALDGAYMAGNIAESTRLMYDIGKWLARIEYGVKDPGDHSAMVEALVCRDERFGVGLWFLGLLRETPATSGLGQANDTDVLLGIYFLAAWARRYL